MTIKNDKRGRLLAVSLLLTCLFVGTIYVFLNCYVFFGSYTIGYKHKFYDKVYYFPRGIINPLKEDNIKISVLDYMQKNLVLINKKAKLLSNENYKFFDILSIKKVHKGCDVLVRFKNVAVDNYTLVFTIDNTTQGVIAFY